MTIERMRMDFSKKLAWDRSLARSHGFPPAKPCAEKGPEPVKRDTLPGSVPTPKIIFEFTHHKKNEIIYFWLMWNWVLGSDCRKIQILGQCV